MIRIVKQPEERRADIIRVARSLFQARSYANTSMQDVMDELGIAKGTIYYYFKSKDELLEGVVTDIVDEAAIYMQTLADQTKGGAMDKLSVLIKAGNLTEDNRSLWEDLHRQGNENMHVRILAMALAKQAPIYAELIKQGCAEGIFQTDTPFETAECMLTAFSFLTDVGIYHWTQEDIARRIQAFPLIIEAQLMAPKGSFKSIFSI
jgi:AcrR family transcriptional regulator